MDAATKISVDRMERAGYLPALRAIAKIACVPFWWHGVADDGRYRIHHNGTVCFLNTGKRLIGVTAHHVFDAYRTARQAQPDLRCQFGSTTVEPERRLIAESKYLDLATFDISPIVITSAGAAPHTPTAWPTPRAHVKEVMALHEETQRLESLYQQKLAALAALKKSLLHQAFAGEL